jgi:hypothetical protein
MLVTGAVPVRAAAWLSSRSSTRRTAMRYMFLIYGDPSLAPEYGTPRFDAEMGGWYGLSTAFQESGAFLGGDPLQPPQTATTVRVRDAKTVTTDGPFAETKEVLGGFYMAELPDLDAAIAWAEKFPNVGYGSIEIRPIMELG